MANNSSCWYCPKCKEELDGCHVTYQELCEYCGTAVLSVPESISQETIEEIIKAKAEGRLVLLPCKVGDVVYRKARFSDCVIEATVSQLTINKFGIIGVASRGENTSFHFDSEDIGERVFFTREAAEKALGGGEG